MKQSLGLLLVLLFFGCGTGPTTPPTHHDALIEKWIGKKKQELIKALGPPTREARLPSGESTLVWEKPNCYISFDTDKQGVVSTGANNCAGRENN